MEIYKEVDWIEGFKGVAAVSNLGNVVWLRSGKLAEPDKGRGYPIVWLCKNGCRKRVKVHRLVAMAFVPNRDPTVYDQVDHIDRVKTNNNATNLRWVTIEENNRNLPKPANASSRFIGVKWDKVRKKWAAYVYFDREYLQLGYFAVEEDAAQARDAYVRGLGGVGWRFNFPM
jgi:hypothetical protein